VKPSRGGPLDSNRLSTLSFFRRPGRARKQGVVSRAPRVVRQPVIILIRHRGDRLHFRLRHRQKEVLRSKHHISDFADDLVIRTSDLRPDDLICPQTGGKFVNADQRLGALLVAVTQDGTALNLRLP
jgi:hypothetical protein